MTCANVTRWSRKTRELMDGDIDCIDEYHQVTRFLSAALPALLGGQIAISHDPNLARDTYPSHIESEI